MDDKRFQHLAEAFNSIISMMLSMLRARGWRGLLDLPQAFLAAIYLRRLAREFTALLASIDLSALPPPAPAAQVPPAQPAAPAPAARTRPRPAACRGARRARQASSAHPIPAAPNPSPGRTRIPRRAFARPGRVPDSTHCLPPALREARRRS